MDDILARLDSLNIGELRREWIRVIGKDPPKISSRDALRWMLAWQLQSRQEGEISVGFKRRLRALIRSYERNPDYDACVAGLM